MTAAGQTPAGLYHARSRASRTTGRRRSHLQPWSSTALQGTTRAGDGASQKKRGSPRPAYGPASTTPRLRHDLGQGPFPTPRRGAEDDDDEYHMLRGGATDTSHHHQAKTSVTAEDVELAERRDRAAKAREGAAMQDSPPPAASRNPHAFTSKSHRLKSRALLAQRYRASQQPATNKQPTKTAPSQNKNEQNPKPIWTQPNSKLG